MFDLKQARKNISQAMVKDQFRLNKQFNKLHLYTDKSTSTQNSSDDENKYQLALDRFIQALKKSQLERESRNVKNNLDWQVTYPVSLPVSKKVETIKKLILSEQVIIVAGETGSGKSTQLPKICLDLGLGEGGMIGHTQPRRIAARTLSGRISDELKQSMEESLKACQGASSQDSFQESHQESSLEKYDRSTHAKIAKLSDSLVACKMRFSDSVQEHTQIKLMTDGMLLAEIQGDPFLSQYQCIIVDEAHERSLNIDFLLGFLKQLLPKRKDLKLIITSATIDVDKMSQHFLDAPVLEVSGRNFPVDMHYMEDSSDSGDFPVPMFESNSLSNKGFDSENSSTLVEAINSIVTSEFSKKTSPLAQDILVFLATENEIRQESRNLRKRFQQQLNILPLYSRLPLAQQKLIFSSNSKGGKRRLILATNVAETSVTVPNIGFVIDAGTARISRYNARTKVQQLPIEKISQASANQRAGRCGRIAPGVCIRLYSEEDFLLRPEFTQPEIQRTSLASVILKLESLKLGRIEKFPLMDRPDRRYVTDAYKLLFELQAIDKQERLTAMGRKVASLSIDPRYARMLLEADKQSCLEEVLVIVSGLSVNDPRLRPQEYQQQADEKHKLFKHEGSDFLSIYKLWHSLETKRHSSNNKEFKQFCEQYFLSWNSLREWRELHRQLLLQMRSLKLKVKEKSFSEEQLEEVFSAESFSYQLDTQKKTYPNKDPEHKPKNKPTFSQNLGPASYQDIHRAILKGVLTHVAHISDGFAYEGLGRKRLYVFPASSLVKQKNSWLMGAQLLETTKLYAHCCAPVDVAWVLEQADHLITKKIFETFWSKKRGCLMAYQQSTFGGLILEARKPVKVSLELSECIKEDLQGIFIQGALIERRYIKPPAFLSANWEYLNSLKDQEQKLRRVDLLPDDSILVDFYRKLIPETILDLRSFDSWLKEQGSTEFLTLEGNLSFNNKLDTLDRLSLFPNVLPNQNFDALCRYVFDPVLDEDGLNIHIQYDQLNQLDQQALDWLVPGLIEEKCEALIKSLPKALRKKCLPIQNTARACLERMEFGQGNIYQELAKQLSRITAISVSAQDFQMDKLPAHLHSHIVVLDDNQKVLASSSNVNDLRIFLREKLSSLDLQSVESHALAGNSFIKSSIGGSPEVLALPTFTPTRVWDFGDLDSSIYITKKANQQTTIEQSSSKLSSDYEDSNSKASSLNIKQETSYKIKMFSALKAGEEEVGLAYFDSEEAAAICHEKGQRALMSLALASTKRDLKKRFKQKNAAVLKLFSAGAHQELFNDLYAALIDQVFFLDADNNALQAMPKLVYQQKDFELRLSKGKPQVFASSQLLFNTLDEIADKVFTLRQALASPGSDLRKKHLSMIEGHLLDLIRPNFVNETPLPMLLRFPAYLDGMHSRLNRLQGNIDRDQQFQDTITQFKESYMRLHQVQESFTDFKGAIPGSGSNTDQSLSASAGLSLSQEKRGALKLLSCLLEEFAMSQFSQNKKTLLPVSEKLLKKQISLLEGQLLS